MPPDKRRPRHGASPAIGGERIVLTTAKWARRTLLVIAALAVAMLVSGLARFGLEGARLLLA